MLSGHGKSWDCLFMHLHTAEHVSCTIRGEPVVSPAQRRQTLRLRFAVRTMGFGHWGTVMGSMLSRERDECRTRRTTAGPRSIGTGPVLLAAGVSLQRNLSWLSLLLCTSLWPRIPPDAVKGLIQPTCCMESGSPSSHLPGQACDKVAFKRGPTLPALFYKEACCTLG